MNDVDTHTLESLERLIEQQIALGQKNPHEFFPLLEEMLGDDLFTVAKPYLADFVTEMARQKLNAQRRAAVARITPTTLANPDVKLRALWIPDDDGRGITYKRIADMSADDFDARAGYLERMMLGISRHAGWCRQVAAELRELGLATANELERLPALPELDDIAT